MMQVINNQLFIKIIIHHSPKKKGLRKAALSSNLPEKTILFNPILMLTFQHCPKIATPDT
jgi:hypothetical protein